MRYTTPYQHPLLPNPLFNRDRALLPKRVQNNAHTRRHTFMIYALTLGLGVIGWLLLWGHWLSDDVRQSTPYWYSYLPYNWNANTLLLLGIVSVMLDLMIDLSSASSSTSLINSEVVTGRWDVLRLTLLNSDQITRSKYAIAQLRLWRLTNFTIALRMLLLLLLILTTTLATTWIEEDSTWQLSNFVSDILAQPVHYGLIGLIFLVIGLTYIIEPYWRMKAITAAGLLISTYTQRLSFSLLAGFMASGAMILSQIALAFAYGYIIVEIIEVLHWDGYRFSDEAGLALALLLVSSIAALIFLYYRTVQVQMLKRVTQRIGQQD